MPDFNEGDIKFIDIWSIFKKYKWLIIFVVLVGTTISAIYAFTIIPIYRAEVLLAPVSRESQQGNLTALTGKFGGLAAMAGIDIGLGGSDKDTVIAILKSRLFVDNFIREKNLLPLLFDSKWDSQKGKWIVENEKQKPTMWQAYKLFNSICFISEDKKTGLVTLAIEWKDPKLAANWANELVSEINRQLKLDAISESDRRLEYLRQQLAKTDVVAVQQSMFGLIEAEMKNAMLANVSDEYAFRTIDPAIAPEERIRPKRKVIIIAGLILGSMFGVFLAVFRNYTCK